MAFQLLDPKALLSCSSLTYSVSTLVRHFSGETADTWRVLWTGGCGNLWLKPQPQKEPDRQKSHCRILDGRDMNRFAFVKPSWVAGGEWVRLWDGELECRPMRGCDFHIYNCKGDEKEGSSKKYLESQILRTLESNQTGIAEWRVALRTRVFLDYMIWWQSEKQVL